MSKLPLVVSLALLAPLAEARNQPNIILFLADDVGYGDIGPYDHDNDPVTPMVTNTPVIDTLASEGLTMTQFYANASVCSPTRVALLTGRHPVRNSITAVFTPFHTIGLPPSEVTIAEILRPLGYRTYWSGKWHLGHLPDFLPTNQGFDEFYGVPYSNDMLPFSLMRNTTVIDPDADQAMVTQYYTTEAKAFISEAASLGKPFFLVVGYTMPHIPVYVSPAFEDITGRGLYEDAMFEMDSSIGEIMGHLQQLGLEQDTLTIFTSDNGACDPAKPAPVGVPDPWRWVECGSNAPFPGFKAQVREGAVRMPFVVRWPGVLAPGSSSDVVGSCLDMLPTLAALTGAPLPAGVELDGRELLTTLLTGAPPPPTNLHFYQVRASGGDPIMRAMRAGDWKLYLDGTFQPSFHVDLAEDPYESQTLNDPVLEAILYDQARNFDCAVKAATTYPEPIGKNLAPDSLVSTSSSVSCNTSQCAIDGTAQTLWASESAGTEWLTLDLREPKPISEAVLTWGLNHAVQYRIEVGADGTTWTELYTESSGKGGTERITLPCRARYVRLTGLQSAGANYELQELALFGKTLLHPPVEEGVVEARASF